MTTPSETPAEQSATELPLPSVASLVKATIVALVVALLLLVLVVLPADYNFDPTGFGAAVGLTRLSAPTDDTVSDDTSTPGEQEDLVAVAVPAGGGVEYKFALRTGDKMKYQWSVDTGALFFDFHGEPEGDTTGFFESYVAMTSNESRGTFTAPFDGVHGWYWKNNGPTVANVTLMTSGTYAVLGLR